MAKRIILRYPEGVSLIETDDEFALMQKFIAWIIGNKHFSKHEEHGNESVFTFTSKSYVSVCNIKWKKLCNNQS